MLSPRHEAAHRLEASMTIADLEVPITGVESVLGAFDLALMEALQADSSGDASTSAPNGID